MLRLQASIGNQATERLLKGTGPGSPLAPALQGEMERRFGFDFSGVRVHSGGAAAQAADRLHADAYTFGSDIVFGAGQFAPGTADGRRLIAHELAHVVQQSHQPDNERRIQRKKRKAEKGLTVVKVVAFEGAESGQATLSDGTREDIVLSANALAPGSYLLELDPTQRYGYRRSAGDDRPGEFRWATASILEGPWERAEVVQVVILEGNLSTLQADIQALPPHIQKFLTTGEGPMASFEEIQSVAEAGRLLEASGVTEEELLLLAEGAGTASPSAKGSVDAPDPAKWAREFVQTRQEAGERALATRRQIVDVRTRAGKLHWKFNRVVRDLILADRDSSWKYIQRLFDSRSIDLPAFMAAFERELAGVTSAFLSQARAVLIRLENMYLAGRNVGAEKEALRRAVEKIRPAFTERDVQAEALEASQARAGFARLTGSRSEDAALEKAKAELAGTEKGLEERGREANLPVVNWEGFDPDIIYGAPRDSRAALRAFVSDARAKIQAAEQKVKDVKTLYQADRMVELAKAAAGIEKGSVLYEVIDYRAKLAGEDGFWSKLWDVVAIALMFVPGNVGVLLRVVAGAVGTSKALDDYALRSTLHHTGLSSQAASGLGVFLAASGTLIDAQQMARGAVKVLGGEGGGAAHLAPVAPTPAAATAVREGEESLVRMGDEIATPPPTRPVPKDIRGEVIEQGGPRRIRGEDEIAAVTTPALSETERRVIAWLVKMDRTLRGAMKELAGKIHGLRGELEGQAIAIVEIKIGKEIRYVAATNAGARGGWAPAQKAALEQLDIKALEPIGTELVHAEPTIRKYVAELRAAGETVQVLRWGVSAGWKGSHICDACQVIQKALGGFVETFDAMGKT